MFNRSVPEDLSGAAHIVSVGGESDLKGAYDRTFNVLPTRWNIDMQKIPEFSKDDGTYEMALKMNALDIELYDYAREKFGDKLNLSHF